MELPGFELTELIGQGGMATVWKARQRSLNRTVAVKILSQRLAGDPADIERFRHECQAAARLKHPGIVQVHDAGVLQGIYYYVMEYVAGESVGQMIRRHGPLGEQKALGVAEAVAEALGYAWGAAGIIHCDVKPDNIMVDADGTVKVADLGLARTIGRFGGSAASRAGEVMGTPNYISPEQAQGAADLDCRTDIYALGASLYHMVTGQMLFQGSSSHDAMEKQTHDFAPDPLSLNHKLSPALCWLIEKMLVKDRAGRQRDWAAVTADIAAVRKGRRLAGPPPAEHASTVRRHPLRTARDLRGRGLGPARLRTEEISSGHLGWLVPVLVAAVAAAVLMAAAARKPRVRLAEPQPAAAPRQAAPPERTQPEQPLTREERAVRLYEASEAWARANPDRYDEAIFRFESVVREGRGTETAANAQARIRQIQSARHAAERRIVADLDEKTAPLVDAKKYAEAAALFEGYGGPLADATRDSRTARAAELRRRAADAEAKARDEMSKREQTECAALLDAVVASVLRGDAAAASSAVTAALQGGWLSARRDEVLALDAVLRQALAADETVLASFQKDRGKTISVQTLEGERTVSVRDIRAGSVYAGRSFSTGDGSVASAAFTFKVADLAPAERAARLKGDDRPGALLARGMFALKANQFQTAQQCFARLAPPLSEPLCRQAAQIEAQYMNEAAKQDLQRLLAAAGIPVGPYDPAAWLSAARARPMAYELRRHISLLLGKYMRTYQDTEFAKKNKELLDALEAAAAGGQSGGPGEGPAAAAQAQPQHAPEAQPQRKESRAPTGAAMTEEAVRRWVTARNMAVLDQEIMLNQSGRFPGPALRINSTQIADYSAIGELTDLVEIELAHCRVPDVAFVAPLGKLRALSLRNCEVGDLSALRRSSVEDLDLSHTDVRDLRHLTGSALKALRLDNTRVVSLTPVAGLPLAGLAFNRTAVKDIACLRGMALTRLEMEETRVHDFMPLRGMPLAHLSLRKCVFREAADLAGMPLKHFDAGGTELVSLEPLKDMPLEALILEQCTGIRDFTPLRKLALKRLRIGGTMFRDMELLRDMPLRHLALGGDLVGDLSALKGKALEWLDISQTAVENLTPLAGQPIAYLYLDGAPIRDITPIRRMPLVELRCAGTRVRDFSPLRSMPVQYLSVGDAVGLARPFFDAMPNLRQVNGEPWPPR